MKKAYIIIILLLIIIVPKKIYAMDVDITYTNSRYYDYTGVNSYNAITTTRVLTDLQFYKFEADPNDIDARDFMSVIYFPEIVNDQIRTGQWDISFLIMTQGSPMVMLDTKGCELVNPVPEETWYMFTDSQGHTYHDVITNEGQNTFYAVNCYNTSFINIPIRLRVFNTYEWSKQTITISRYWNFSQVEKPATNSGVEQAITNQTTQVTSAIEDIENADYNGNTEQPDTSNYDDYEDAEEDLLDSMSEMDLDDVTIAIDTNSSNFVWNTMTSLIQSNALIFSMIISILSIGVIKLMLGR